MAADARYDILSTFEGPAEEDEAYPKSEKGLFGSLSFTKKDFFGRSRTFAALLYILSGILIIACSKFPTDGQCTRKMSTWSPMMEAVEYEWQTWDMTIPSKYMGKPTSETEMEWDRLWQYGSVGISEDKLHLLNKSLEENWLHTPSELGGGVTALFDGFHQVHCLNLVRQYTYRDQYNYHGLPAFDQSPAMLLDHVEHCIEMIRIDLMCFSDETPYLIIIENNGNEAVQANALHRCRKFEKLIAWAEKHVVEPYNATMELLKHADRHWENNASVADD